MYWEYLKLHDIKSKDLRKYGGWELVSVDAEGIGYFKRPHIVSISYPGPVQHSTHCKVCDQWHEGDGIDAIEHYIDSILQER